MTHGVVLLQAWVGCWGLKCKREMRDDEADSLSVVCFAGKRGVLIPVCVGKFRSRCWAVSCSGEWCIRVGFRLLCRYYSKIIGKQHMKYLESLNSANGEYSTATVYWMRQINVELGEEQEEIQPQRRTPQPWNPACSMAQVGAWMLSSNAKGWVLSGFLT